MHYTNIKKQLKINFSLQCAYLKPAEINLCYFGFYLRKPLISPVFETSAEIFVYIFSGFMLYSNKPFQLPAGLGKREGCESALSTLISNLYTSCFHSLLLITEAET